MRDRTDEAGTIQAVKPVFLGLYSGDLRSAKIGIDKVERLKSYQKRWDSTREADKMAAGS
ncbi:hypothetical protein ADS79_24280 [Brevibacillus reuszeri]|uniref:Uncharacterized protein n=1 Tax=Brevibacillus reuszeri TaxID=54915 RepID=A0A0K9YT19_9BACL|nr:hypothetical protein ADS79_24280 [Brevibacillus reuszeri]